MRVTMYYSNSDVRIQELPVPKIGPGELLLRVEASGICGTDVMEWYRRDKVPLVLGHEIAGVIEEAGSGAPFKKGTRVAASHHVPCGACHYCKMGHETVCETLRRTKFEPGGFAEFLRVPAINVEKKGVYVLPDSVSFEEATFIEPLACVLRGQRLGGLKKGMRVLVIGSGISGLLHIQMAGQNGASNITATDISDYRLKAAKLFGADEAVEAGKYDGRPADFVILCAGADGAVKQAFESVDRGGIILIFAAAGQDAKIQKSINDIFWRNEVTLVSSYAGTPAEHRQALELIRSRKINVKDMITHRLPLKDAVKGFQLVAGARESIKVIIEPQK